MIEAQEGFDPVGLLIIQPTPFCNINCSYCYLSTRAETRRISIETVEAIARFLCDVPVSNSSLNICWHAGEPLVVPISFYERAFSCFAETPGMPEVRHTFQTNGTLIDKDWCDFFRRWSVDVGVSVDGPQAIHDSQRVDRAGRGTFDRVMRGISRLHQHEVPFSVISVLTKESLNAPDAIWRFYRSNGISRVAFNIDEEEGVHKESSLNASEHLSAFRDFMSRIADLQERDPSIEVRELASMRQFLTASATAEVKKADNRPGAILNVDVDGNLTTFSPELLGQVHPHMGDLPGEMCTQIHGNNLCKMCSYNALVLILKREWNCAESDVPTLSSAVAAVPAINSPTTIPSWQRRPQNVALRSKRWPT